MFNETRKSWDSGKDGSIVVITNNDTTYTNTSGACFLTGFSVSNISKLARNNSIASTDFGKSRLIDIASLRSYYDTERKQPSAATQERDALRDYATKVAKVLASKTKDTAKLEQVATLTLALDAKLQRLEKIEAAKKND